MSGPASHNAFIPVRYVPLQTFNNYIEANIVLKMLQDAGINCHLQDEHVNTIVNLSSGMQLMVYHTQADRARRMLEEAALAIVQSTACTICGEKSLQVKEVMVDMKPQLGPILSFFSRWLSSEGTMVKMNHYTCLHCGAEFEDLPKK